MTEADKIYVALVGNMKKYGVEHSVSALQKYITEGDNVGFTRDDNAREFISQLTPEQVLAESLRGVLKYQIIAQEKNLPKFGTNEQEVLKAVYQFQHGYKIDAELGTAELERLITMMLDYDIQELLDMFEANPELFENYLAFYSNLLCNYRNDMNKIDNNNFSQINEYLEKEVKGEKQK